MGLIEANKIKQKDSIQFPEDWLSFSLGYILTFKNGLNKESEFFGYGTPILNYMDVFNNYGLYEKDIKGKVFLSFQEKNNFSAKKGDVFFTRTSETQEEIGTAAVLLEDIEDCVFSGFVLRGRPDTNLVDKHYFQYCFTPEYLRTQIVSMSSYTTRAIINGTSLAKVNLVIPPTLNEQKCIAQVLSDTDVLIQALEKKIAKKKLIKKGVMQKLLTPKVGWEVKTLSKVGEIITGGTPPTTIKSYWGGKIPWVTPTDIRTQKNINSSEREITKEGLGVIRKLPPNTLLVTCIASIGKNSILRKEGACNQQINAIVPNDSNNVDFLYYLIENNVPYIRGKAGITATLMISKKDFSEITFAFPENKIEQNKIAQILSDIDIELELLKQKLSKYQLAKEGMMQQLLTGKIRLV